MKGSKIHDLGAQPLVNRNSDQLKTSLQAIKQQSYMGIGEERIGCLLKYFFLPRFLSKKGITSEKNVGGGEEERRMFFGEDGGNEK